MEGTENNTVSPPLNIYIERERDETCCAQTWKLKNEKYSRLSKVNWRFSLWQSFLWISLSVLVFVAQLRSYLITHLNMGRVKERYLTVWCPISKNLKNRIFDDAAIKEQEAT